ncbi:hypothetical protein EI94DRAFT_1800312 [Lactarius quietus]|nr:hypothetical protein EI94DRAFT_1800312 [Lactarius quietus]
MTPPRASRSKSRATGGNPAPPPMHSDSRQGGAGTSSALLDFMSKVPLPIGDVPPSLPGIVPTRSTPNAGTSKPSASEAAAAPQLISSSQTPDPLSVEIMPPPRDVPKKAPPTGGVCGFLDNIPLLQRITPVLPKEAEEPVTAQNIGSIGDGGDIGPQDESDTEDDDSDEDDIQALDIPIPMNTGPPVFTPCIYLPLQGPPPAVLPPIRYMNAPAAEVAAAAVAAVAAVSTAGAATTTALAAGPPGSRLDEIERDLEHIPPHLLGRLKKARFGLAEMMRELAETSYQSDLPSGASDPSPQHLVPPVAFVITPRDSVILQEHVTQFQNGNAGVRAKIIEKVIPELYQFRPPNPLFDKKDAGKKWFYNHYNRLQRQYTKFTRKWSSRSAFYQLNRDEVLELARETSGMDPGAPGFLGALQDATTVLWNALDADDQEDYAQAAKEWSQDASPAHVQSRMASSLRKRIIQDFQRQLFKTCGIRTLVLSTYKTEDNDLSIGLDDVESVLDDGISFLEFCPDWKTAPLWEQWTQFGIHCFSQVDDPLEEDPVEVLPKPDRSKMITTKIPISMNMSACPELPTVTMLDGYKTKVVQSMLREYCTTHMKNQVIPWGSLVNDPLSWIPQECIPDGFEWKDPSKIQIGEIFCLLRHWRDRQDQGHAPLTWVPSCPAFQEGQPSQCLQKIRAAVVAMQPLESDEEVLVLPASDEIDEEEDGFDPGNNAFVEEPLSVIDAFQVGSDVAGTSAMPLIRQRPYKGKGTWYIDVPDRL